MNSASSFARDRFTRDWLLLPLLGLATISLIAGTVGILAGRLYGKSAEGIEKCLEYDPAIGVHGKANSFCAEKGHETALIEYRLNRCGHRMDVECGPPQPGTYRIVLMGSSLAMGQWIPREKSLAALLPAELSRRTGRKVEIYNVGMMSEHPQVAVLRFDEVLKARPDMVLWVLTPYDIGTVTQDPSTMISAPATGAPATRGWDQLKAAIQNGTVVTKAAEVWQKAQKKFLDSSTGVMLQHYLYLSQAHYVDAYLHGSDSTAGFLRATPSAAWKVELKEFDRVAGKVEDRAKAAGIAMQVVLVPNRAEAAMISMGQWPSGYDPYKLGAELRKIVESHGQTYVDILPDFRNIPNAGQYFFPVDSHPDASGHALLSKMLAKDLTLAPTGKGL